MFEFPRSMLSFSWAMSLFGVQQVANLLAPSTAVKAFDEVTRATEAELTGLVKEVFQVGDEIIERTFGAADAPAAPHPRDTGWGPMPGATAPLPDSGAVSPAEPDISPDYPYQPHYLDVYGTPLHYIDEGSGAAILLLHGNPTWSYLWRNVIPHLSPLGRVVAPDLAGYGRSGKPDIEYRWADHMRYLERFIEELGLRNIVLVVHDHGSALGFQYAMRHEENVRGIAFLEAMVRPFPWESFSSPVFRELFRKFRSGGVGGEGWRLLVEQNVFIEQVLPEGAGRPLTETEMNFYREPFRTEASRVPIWRLARETPIGGEPPDNWEAASAYSDWLKRSELPKLMLYATPGALLTAEHVAWCQRNIRNLESVYVGTGVHFIQEARPHRIGREIAQWYETLPAAPGHARE